MRTFLKPVGGNHNVRFKTILSKNQHCNELGSFFPPNSIYHTIWNKRCTPVNTVLVMGVRITIIYMYSRIHVSCKTSFTCIQEYMYHCAAPLCYYPAKSMFVRVVKQTIKTGLWPWKIQVSTLNTSSSTWDWNQLRNLIASTINTFHPNLTDINQNTCNG